MNAATFPEANCKFGHPSDLDESQVFSIPAFKGTVVGGNMDGSDFVVVAWLPTSEELGQLKSGAKVYLTMIGGLAPHFLTTEFKQATNL